MGNKTKVAGERLRVAVVTASLARWGGAERQAVYIAHALSEASVDVRVFYLTGGEFEEPLRRMGVKTNCFGVLPGPPLRLMLLLAAVRSFRPHIIQSVHAYTNLYSAIVGRMVGAISIGGLRADLEACFEENGRFAQHLITWPDAVAANSRRALDDITNKKLLEPSRIHFLPNAVDLATFSESLGIRTEEDVDQQDAEITCVTIGRLFPFKRVDVFLRALASARSSEPRLKGVVVGWGPEARRLQQLAAELGLPSNAITFLGLRPDIAPLLQKASMFVFCSESEGTPNVILEAMAAGLPILTTPAGDSADVVESAGAGYVLPFGSVEATADAMLRLAQSPALRRKLGNSGREYVSRHRDLGALGGLLMKIYAKVARTSGRRCREVVLGYTQRFSEQCSDMDLMKRTPGEASRDPSFEAAGTSTRKN